MMGFQSTGSAPLVTNTIVKNPETIAHKVLADRIAERDPGNKPYSGDRIPFAYIKPKNKTTPNNKNIVNLLGTVIFLKEYVGILLINNIEISINIAGTKYS